MGQKQVNGNIKAVEIVFRVSIVKIIDAVFLF
jgi:hypothetical protein